MVVAGQPLTLHAGQTHLVSRGVPHTFKNADSVLPVRFRSLHTPGLHFERLLGSMYDLDLDGKTDDSGTPGFLPLMALLAHHPDVTLILGPPRLAQLALAKTMGTLARLLGHPGVYRSASRELSRSR